MVKTWALRLLFAGAVLLLLATPWLLAQHDKQQAPQNLPSFESVVPPPLHAKGPQIVYKWQDDKGGWHYADRPPRNHVWKVITVSPDSNLMPAKPKKNKPAGSGVALQDAPPVVKAPGNRPDQDNPFGRLAQTRPRFSPPREGLARHHRLGLD